MAQNYTRQSAFSDGDTITATLFNDEYNQLVNTFTYSSSDASATGHRHDGSTGEGGNIYRIGDLDFLNKIEADSVNNRWGFWVEVSSIAVEQLRIQDGAIVPVTDNDIDLGTSSLEFKNLYLDGTAKVDALVVDETATITGATTLSSTLAVTGAATLSSDLTVTGNTTLGNAATDTVTITADVSSNLIPSADSTYTLGDSSNYWSAGYIDALTTTGNVSVGGNLTVTGNATISGNLTFGDADTDTVSFSADVSSHILPDVDDTYDLGSSTKEWRNLYVDGTANIDSLVADTADINGGTIDGAIIATSDVTVGAGKTLDVSAGTLTLADNQISGDKVEGGTIAATTITSLASTTVDTTNIEVTNLKAKDGTAAGSIADSTGVVTLASSVLTTTDINGGSVDGVTLGTNSAVTEAQIDNININGNTISSTDTNGNVTITPDGTGSVAITKIDVAGGEIDGTAIGANSASTAVFTDLTASGTVSFSGATVSDGGTVTTVNIDGGNIDGVTIGGSSAGAITGTTGQFNTSLNVDGTVTADGLTSALTASGASVTVASLKNDGAGANTKADLDFFAASTKYAAISGGYGAAAAEVDIKVGNAPSLVAKFSEGGDISFYEDTGTTPKFFWDASAESLTVGSTQLNFSTTKVQTGDGSTSAAGFNVFTSSTGDGYLLFSDGNVGNQAYTGQIRYNHASDFMAFGTNGGAERARLDANGNFMVGTTDRLVADGTGTGLVLGGQSDLLHVSRYQGDCAKFNRVNNDGNIVTFAKDGTAVGTIGSGGGDLNIGTNDTRIRFNDATDNLVPLNASNGYNDAAITLGDPTARFKDLYLSGGLPGTAAGSLVINENGVDSDFRVESDTDTHALFVDAGNSSVGINTSSPSFGTGNGLEIYNSDTGVGVGGGTLRLTRGDISSTADDPIGTIEFYSKDADGAHISAFIQSTAQELYARQGDLIFGTAQGVAVDAVEATRITNLGALVHQKAAVFNESGGDNDFRVESQSNANMIFADAGNSQVNINNNVGKVHWGSSALMDLNIAGAKNYPGMSVMSYSTTNNAGGMVILGRSRNATAGTFTTTNTGDHHGYVIFEGVNGNNTLVGSAYIAGYQIAGSGASYIPGQLRFLTGTNAASPTSRLTIDYISTVFNENGTDTDFRVESDNNTHMLFVDAGNDRIGINDSSPSYQLDLGGGTTVSRRLQLQRGTDDANQNMVLGWNGIDVTRTNVSINSAQTTFSINQVGSDGTRNVFYVDTDGGIVLNEDSYDADFRVESDNNTHALFVDAGNGRVGVNNSSPTKEFDVTGSMNVTQAGGDYAATFTTAFDYVAKFVSSDAAAFIVLQDSGSTDNYNRIGAVGDSIQIESGNVENAIFTSGSSVFNENSVDMDFRVESDNNTHALFVDAGNDRVTVGGRFAVDELGGSGITNYRTYQMVNGEATAAASNVYKDIVEIGFTAVLNVRVIAVQTSDQAGTWAGSVAASYGGGTTGVTAERYQGGNITNIEVRYDNTASTIQVRVIYTGTAPTIYWTVDGMTIGAMENLA